MRADFLFWVYAYLSSAMQERCRWLTSSTFPDGKPRLVPNYGWSFVDSDPFASAIRADGVDLLQTLLATVSFNFNYAIPPYPCENDQPISLLAFSARSRSLKCVKYLLMNQANVTNFEFTEAIRGGHPEIIRMIDNSKAGRPDDKVLSVALESFQFDVFAWLVNEKFPDSLTSKLGILATMAAKAGNLPGILFLIRHGLEATLSEDSDLFTDVGNGLCSLASVTVLSVVLSPKANSMVSAGDRLSGTQTGRILAAAAATGSIRVLEFVCRSGLLAVSRNDVDAVAVLASGHGHLDVLRFIIARLPHIQPAGLLAALCEALKHHHTDIINFILRRRDLPSDLMPALLVACECGHPEVVKRLTRRLFRADRDFSDAVMSAVRGGATSCALFLIDEDVFFSVEKLAIALSSGYDPLTVNAVIDRLPSFFCNAVVNEMMKFNPATARNYNPRAGGRTSLDIDEETFRHLITQCAFNPRWVARAVIAFKHRVDIVRAIGETFESKVPREVLSGALSAALDAAIRDEVANQNVAAVRYILGRPECDRWAVHSDEMLPFGVAASLGFFAVAAELIDHDRSIVGDDIKECNEIQW
jgi:hypothetical protein